VTDTGSYEAAGEGERHGHEEPHEEDDEEQQKRHGAGAAVVPEHAVEHGEHGEPNAREGEGGAPRHGLPPGDVALPDSLPDGHGGVPGGNA
jgi:hypothetical protein